jgi:hypothetical protein
MNLRKLIIVKYFNYKVTNDDKVIEEQMIGKVI